MTGIFKFVCVIILFLSFFHFGTEGGGGGGRKLFFHPSNFLLRSIVNL
jgi:hypothetical protein